MLSTSAQISTWCSTAAVLLLALEHTQRTPQMHRAYARCGSVLVLLLAQSEVSLGSKFASSPRGKTCVAGSSASKEQNNHAHGRHGALASPHTARFTQQTETMNVQRIFSLLLSSCPATMPNPPLFHLSETPCCPRSPYKQFRSSTQQPLSAGGLIRPGQ